MLSCVSLNSAGVGRTGSLISIDVELQRARREGVVDPFNFILKMRDQRNQMVQTEVQKYKYNFTTSKMRIKINSSQIRGVSLNQSVIQSVIITQAQYVFLHDAILEGLTSGDTETPVEILSARMKELEQVDHDGETGYRNEFKVYYTDAQ